ncbi:MULTISPECIES: hypothetical protein [Mangrovibacter]|jgi:hypothetical protein|uniref:Uncharacterized protein n=1 Tax=Mangrovibacter plantisponsor TaxID=451513 RepID=A0A317Q4B4_9ENTR|nr:MULTISPECIES: hypothetical protein [Mangrovibacter]PWW09955.1 hypothetical protein DES37_10449 [Mangrovibacter plantisponsor]
MILLLPMLKVLVVISLLFGLWLICGSSSLFAILAIIITGGLWFKRQDLL